MNTFFAKNNFVLQWLWRLGIIVVTIIVWYYNIETKTHAADTYVSKDAARADYLSKEVADQTYLKKEVQEAKESEREKRDKIMMESLTRIEKKIDEHMNKNR
jgi:hypothetical protein